MNETVIVERPTVDCYRIKKGFEWAYFYVHPHGLLTIHSDYGIYGYGWGGAGPNFKKSLTRFGVDYVSGKLFREVPDVEATVKGYRRLVLEHRHAKGFTADDAREAWDALDGCNGEFELSLWEGNHGWRIDCIYEHRVMEYPPGAKALMAEFWPLFIETLKAELAGEEVKPT